MIINEKRLARALKSSGAIGFRLRVIGGRMEIIGAGWAAYLQFDVMEEPPKLVLAALVEVLGYLPGSGDCISVTKGKGGWAAQGMQDAVFSEEFGGYLNDNFALQACAVLPLRLGAQQLIQALDRRVYAVGAGWGLRDSNCAAYLDTGCAVLCDRESALAVRLGRADEPGPVWAWLESRDWFDDTEGGCEGGGACA